MENDPPRSRGRRHGTPDERRQLLDQRVLADCRPVQPSQHTEGHCAEDGIDEELEVRTVSAAGAHDGRHHRGGGVRQRTAAPYP